MAVQLYEIISVQEGSVIIAYQDKLHQTVGSALAIARPFATQKRDDGISSDVMPTDTMLDSYLKPRRRLVGYCMPDVRRFRSSRYIRS